MSKFQYLRLLENNHILKKEAEQARCVGAGIRRFSTTIERFLIGYFRDIQAMDEEVSPE